MRKEQAAAAAEQLLEMEREKRGHAARRWPPALFRQYPELELFAPARRPRVLRTANAKANRHWHVVLACFAWLAGAFVVCGWLLPQRWGGEFAYLVVGFLFAVPFYLVRRAYVKRYIVEQLAANEESWDG